LNDGPQTGATSKQRFVKLVDEPLSESSFGAQFLRPFCFGWVRRFFQKMEEET
jgi:hypothetical protein